MSFFFFSQSANRSGLVGGGAGCGLKGWRVSGTGGCRLVLHGVCEGA